MTKFWTVYVIRFVSIFFVTSVIIASFFFPGGNIHNPNQVGYSFSHNFLSELGGYITFAGDINSISSFFFNTALFCFLLPLFIMIIMFRVWLRTNVASGESRNKKVDQKSDAANGSDHLYL